MVQDNQRRKQARIPKEDRRVRQALVGVGGASHRFRKTPIVLFIPFQMPGDQRLVNVGLAQRQQIGTQCLRHRGA